MSLPRRHMKYIEAAYNVFLNEGILSYGFQVNSVAQEEVTIYFEALADSKNPPYNQMYSILAKLKALPDVKEDSGHLVIEDLKEAPDRKRLRGIVTFLPSYEATP